MLRLAARVTVRCFSTSANLPQRSALVTGGALGLGEAICRRLADDGYSVFVADVDETAGTEVADAIGGTFLSCNVCNPNEVNEAVQNVVNSAGSLDALVTSAGIVGSQVPMGDYDIEEWQKVLNVNLNGLFYSMKFGLTQMAKQSTGGSIVNISSIAGYRGIMNLSPYTASKWAVRGMTQSAATEYGYMNIRVNAIAPTGCETPMVKGFIDGADDPVYMADQLTSQNAQPGFPQPSDVADVTAFLLSDEARYITGHTLNVDAGSLSRIPNARDPLSVKRD